MTSHQVMSHNITTSSIGAMPHQVNLISFPTSIIRPEFAECLLIMSQSLETQSQAALEHSAEPSDVLITGQCLPLIDSRNRKFQFLADL